MRTSLRLVGLIVAAGGLVGSSAATSAAFGPRGPWPGGGVLNNKCDGTPSLVLNTVPFPTDHEVNFATDCANIGRGGVAMNNDCSAHPSLSGVTGVTGGGADFGTRCLNVDPTSLRPYGGRG